MTDLIHAPWTAEQVTALNAFQHHGRMHPFTCGATHASGQSPVLVATNSGWVCPDPQCVYRQDWAHAFMAAPAVSVPSADQTTDRAALRQRIAEALAREDAHNAGYDHGFAGSYGADEETDGFVDAVLAVLPEPADRAAECPQCGNTGACNGGPCPLRRLAAEAPTTTRAEGPDDEALRAKVDEATATLRRVRSVVKLWEQQTLPHSQAHQLLTEVRDALAGPRPDPETDTEPTEEQIVREHVTTVHLIGEQLAGIESWMWEHLAYVRAHAVAQDPNAPAAGARQDGAQPS
jgi:hypothetical protein